MSGLPECLISFHVLPSLLAVSSVSLIFHSCCTLASQEASLVHESKFSVAILIALAVFALL